MHLPWHVCRLYVWCSQPSEPWFRSRIQSTLATHTVKYLATFIFTTTDLFLCILFNLLDLTINFSHQLNIEHRTRHICPLCICWEYYIAFLAKRLMPSTWKVDPKLSVWPSGHFIQTCPMLFWTPKKRKTSKSCSSKQKGESGPQIKCLGHKIL